MVAAAAEVVGEPLQLWAQGVAVVEPGAQPEWLVAWVPQRSQEAVAEVGQGAVLEARRQEEPAEVLVARREQQQREPPVASMGRYRFDGERPSVVVIRSCFGCNLAAIEGCRWESLAFDRKCCCNRLWNGKKTGVYITVYR